jgi:hypothetical protein
MKSARTLLEKACDRALNMLFEVFFAQNRGGVPARNKDIRKAKCGLLRSSGVMWTLSLHHSDPSKAAAGEHQQRRWRSCQHANSKKGRTQNAEQCLKCSLHGTATTFLQGQRQQESKVLNVESIWFYVKPSLYHCDPCMTAA